MTDKEQICRIRSYEAMLREAEELLESETRSPAALDRLRALAKALEAYYTGGDWMRDFEADEAGLLPKDLPRGVLSEDGIYDLLEAVGELENEAACLETERLLLRPWAESDAEECFRYASDPRVGPVAGWPAHADVEESRRVIRELLSVPETYAIVWKQTGLPVGCVGLNFRTRTAPGADEAELGYWLGVPWWGRGIMPEAARALLRHAFEDLGLARVWCSYFDGNEKSRRVQEKLGFRYQRTVPDYPVPLLGETRTDHVNCLTAEEWRRQAEGGCFDFAKLSTRFSVRRMRDWDADAILALCLQNTQYYEYCGKQPTKELVLSDLHITPPGIEAADKYYLGFYEGDALVAVMDLILGYPQADVCFIGFFMLDRARQGKQLGSAVVGEACETLRRAGFRLVQLAIDKGNPQSTHFWKKNGFRVTRELEREEGTILVAEKAL